MADNVNLDNAAIYDLLNGPDGPVTRLMEELSEQVVTVARGKARVRHTRTWSNRSDASPPGFMKASIHTNVHWYQGLVYGGAAAAEEPTFFMEDPRVNRERYPFMSTAIDSLEL